MTGIQPLLEIRQLPLQYLDHHELNSQHEMSARPNATQNETK